MARRRYRKNPSGTTWLLIGGGGFLAWQMLKPKPVAPSVGPMIPTAPTSGTGYFDILRNRLKEILGAQTAPKLSAAQLRELREESKELAGLGADYGTLGGGRYGSLS